MTGINKNASDVGKKGEKLARKYLRKCGYRIVAKNLHCSHNELDIIAANRDFIIFVEVKTRSVSDPSSLLVSAAAAVDKKKQMRTIQAARSYLSSNESKKHKNKQPRLDVIEVYLSKETSDLLKLNHIENAFGIK